MNNILQGWMLKPVRLVTIAIISEILVNKFKIISWLKNTKIVESEDKTNFPPNNHIVVRQIFK